MFPRLQNIKKGIFGSLVILILMRWNPFKQEAGRSKPSVTLFGIDIGYPVILEHYCRTAERSVKTLVVVTTRSDAFQRRQVIRNTWGGFIKKNLKVEVLFIIGKIPQNQSEAFWEESKFHGDVIMADFQDSYRNLTLKTGAALFWVDKYCPTATSVIKSDDDTMILPDGLKDLMQYARNISGSRILGWTYDGKGPVRDNSSKWQVRVVRDFRLVPVCFRYLSEAEFPGADFPVYCNGHFYLILGDGTVGKLLEHIKDYSHVPIEDVFFTGILAERANISREISRDMKLRISPLRWDANTTCQYNFVTAHYTSDEQDMREYFGTYSSCRECCVPHFHNYSQSLEELSALAYY